MQLLAHLTMHEAVSFIGVFLLGLMAGVALSGKLASWWLRRQR